MKAAEKDSNPDFQGAVKDNEVIREIRRKAGRRLLTAVMMAIATITPLIIIILYTVSLMVEKLRF